MLHPNLVKLFSLLPERNPDAILFNGLNDCIIGTDMNYNIIYSHTKMVNHFINSGMSAEEAEEWVDYNILNLKIGDNTPIILIDL
jgi:hypothetical protein